MSFKSVIGKLADANNVLRLLPYLDRGRAIVELVRDLARKTPENEAPPSGPERLAAGKAILLESLDLAEDVAARDLVNDENIGDLAEEFVQLSYDVEQINARRKAIAEKLRLGVKGTGATQPAD